MVRKWIWWKFQNYILRHIQKLLKSNKFGVKTVMATTYENKNGQPLKWYMHSGFRRTNLTIIEANIDEIKIDLN